MTQLQQDIKQQAIDCILDYTGQDINACDLHNEVYNTDYFIIGTYEAKQALGMETFDIIEEIKDYEQDNFGEVFTDLSDPERVLNMYAYIIGEQFLQESETLQDKWNETLSDNDLETIKSELEEAI